MDSDPIFLSRQNQKMDGAWGVQRLHLNLAAICLISIRSLSFHSAVG